jgi:hypothetical protein
MNLKLQQVFNLLFKKNFDPGSGAHQNKFGGPVPASIALSNAVEDKDGIIKDYMRIQESTIKSRENEDAQEKVRQYSEGLAFTTLVSQKDINENLTGRKRSRQ